jgi:hypothetical protein
MYVATSISAATLITSESSHENHILYASKHKSFLFPPPTILNPYLTPEHKPLLPLLGGLLTTLLLLSCLLLLGRLLLLLSSLLLL